MANISVIIPCYNAEKTIRETIESVLAQTYQDFEIIVVDDGSTDHSKEIIQSFDNKVNYIFQENSGRSSVARNTGIRAAYGSYLAFVDADDIWLPEKLGKQVRLMEHEGTQWCYCDSIYFRDTDQKEIGKYSKLYYPGVSGWIWNSQFLGNRVCSPTPIIHKSIIEKVGTFDENLVSREDWDLWLRISFEYPVSYVNEVLTRYRVHKSSKTFDMDPDFTFQNLQTVINKVSEMYPDKTLELKDKALAHFACDVSRTHWLNKSYSSAQQMIKQSVELDSENRKYKFFQCIYKFPPILLNSILYIRKQLRG